MYIYIYTYICICIYICIIHTYMSIERSRREGVSLISPILYTCVCVCLCVFVCLCVSPSPFPIKCPKSPPPNTSGSLLRGVTNSPSIPCPSFSCNAEEDKEAEDAWSKLLHKQQRRNKFF